MVETVKGWKGLSLTYIRPLFKKRKDRGKPFHCFHPFHIGDQKGVE